MLLRTEPCVHVSHLISGLSSSLSYKPTFLTKFPNSYRFSFQIWTLSTINNNNYRFCNNKSPYICCKMHSHSHSNSDSYNHESHDEYLEASLLISETMRHHHLRKKGFREEAKEFSTHFVPSFTRVKDIRNVNSIGLSILRRFRHPTIFLKISCEGDFLLPIVVGEFAVEKLINSLNEDHHDGDYSNELQLLRNLVVGLGNEVRLVKITNRVINKYFARIYFGKVEEIENFCVDVRPSDAINVAHRCQAPIYVNKQIFLTDAIQFAYGTGRVRDTKPVYDVLLDSPMDGPGFLVEEFNLVQNMKLAVEQERYSDAAMWRDKLFELLNSITQPSQQTNWNEATTPGLL